MKNAIILVIAAISLNACATYTPEEQAAFLKSYEARKAEEAARVKAVCSVPMTCYSTARADQPIR